MGRLYKTGIGLTTGFIRSQSITQLGYSVLHFTSHNNWVSSVPLKTPAPTAATNSCGTPCHHSLSDNYLLELSDHGCRRPSYIAREQTIKKTPSPIPLLLYDVITGTDPRRKQQFLPLLRCLATVVNKRFHCWLLTYRVHVTILNIKKKFNIIKSKVKVNISLGLIKHHAMKTYGGVEV
jgi:hypothetical protein